jgi:hypothetical protein
MGESEALEVLGPPVSIDERFSPEIWYFEPPTTAAAIVTGVGVKSVVFNTDGKAVRVHGIGDQNALTGMSQEEIADRLGEPKLRFEARAKTLYYSHPPDGGRYRVVAIGISYDGKVAGKFSYWEFD